MNKVGFNRIPAVSIDLVIAGVIYLFSIIFLFGKQPTAAELGYGINSEGVFRDQFNLVLLGIGVWLTYATLCVVLIKRSLGQLLVGINYTQETNIFLRILSVILTPIFIADKFLRAHTHLSDKNSAHKIFTALGSLAALGAIPGLLLFFFIAGFIVFVPRDTNNDFTLCGEKFCIVKANNACTKNLDLARERTVEIVGQEKAGTGMLISDSLVLTNFHVVEGEGVLQVKELNGRTSNAVVYNSNPDLDIAILIGQFTKGEHVQFVNPKDFSEGTDLYAIGYPGSYLRDAANSSISVTKGIYSSFLDFPDYGVQLVQTDTPANPGNSGGPLVNNCGQVMGMVTLSEKFDPLTQTIKEGLNFAISSTTLVPQLNKLAQ